MLNAWPRHHLMNDIIYGVSATVRTFRPLTQVDATSRSAGI